MKSLGRNKKPHRHHLSLLLLLAIAGSGTACAPSPQEEVLSRLIDSDREEALAGLDLQKEFTLLPVWQAPVEGAPALKAWAFYVPDLAAAQAEGGGIDLAPLAQSRYLTWNGTLEAERVDALRFRFAQPLTGQVELYWNGAGEDFAPQRYALRDPDPADPRQVTFDLGSTRTWTGSVARIGIHLLGANPEARTLLGAEGLAYAARPEIGGGEVRFVSLDGKGMAAWLARPGFTVRRRVTVPAGARLRLPVSAWLVGTSGLPIRVVAREASGESREERVLLSTTLRAPANPPHRQWSRFVLDLAPLAGQTVDLAFEAGAAPPGTLALWGNPRLVAERGRHRPNVILISLDTVRADHTSVYGYPRPTTPRLAALAKRRGTVFETAVASAPWTLPSHVSMLSGVEAVHHGVNRHGPVPSGIPLVQQRFRDAGYATYATTAGLLLTPEMGFGRGFDELDVRGKMESLPEWDAEAEAGIDDTLDWLRRHRGQSFFLFFHTYEAHTPYQPRVPWFQQFGGRLSQLNEGQPVWMEEEFEDVVRPRYRLFVPGHWVAGTTYAKRTLEAKDRDLAVSLYDSGLAYLDFQLGRLFDYLREEGLFEDTIVVVTSDHGEALFEHGKIGHSTLYDHDLLVPLVIAAPLRGSRGRRVEAQVRSVDLVPTLLDLAGLPPLPGIDGRSLRGLMRGEPEAPRDAWSYALSTVHGVSLRSERRHTKVIAQDSVFDPFRGGLEVYDLQADPKEEKNLGGPRDAALRRRLLGEVRADGSLLRVEVANAGPGPIEGILYGDAVDAMVTSPDLGFSCCAASPSGVQFKAPAGERFNLWLPGRRAAATLKLRLDRAGRIWIGEIRTRGEAQSLRVSWDQGEWRVAEASAGAPPAGGWTGVELRHEGSTSRAEEGDEQLLKNLRALGYIR